MEQGMEHKDLRYSIVIHKLSEEGSSLKRCLGNEKAGKKTGLEASFIMVLQEEKGRK